MTNTTIEARQKYAANKMEHVGSFLRTPEIKAARIALAEGKISADELRAIEDAAIIKLVAQQKEAGLQSITDGELRRAWWHYDFMENLTGAEAYDAEQGLAFKGITTKPHNVRLKGKIAYNPDHPHFKDFEFLHKVVGDDGYSVAKMTIPSPNMMMRPNIRLNAFYGDNIDQYVKDLGIAYQKSIARFYELGCRYIQLDDVFWAYLIDPEVRKQEEALGTDLDKLAQQCVNTINIALANKPDDLVVGMHICRGNFSSAWHYQGGYETIDNFIFKGLTEIDRYFLEYDDSRSGGFEPLKALQGSNSEVVLGLVTSKTEELENPEAIKRRIIEASQYLPLEQLALSPQCGFSSTEEGNRVPYDAQWRKLKLVKEIVEDVWAE